MCFSKSDGRPSLAYTAWLAAMTLVKEKIMDTKAAPPVIETWAECVARFREGANGCHCETGLRRSFFQVSAAMADKHGVEVGLGYAPDTVPGTMAAATKSTDNWREMLKRPVGEDRAREHALDGSRRKPKSGAALHPSQRQMLRQAAESSVSCRSSR